MARRLVTAYFWRRLDLGITRPLSPGMEMAFSCSAWMPNGFIFPRGVRYADRCVIRHLPLPPEPIIQDGDPNPWDILDAYRNARQAVFNEPQADAHSFEARPFDIIA